MRFFFLCILFTLNVFAMDGINEKKCSVVSQILIEQIREHEESVGVSESCIYKGKLLNNKNLKIDEVEITAYTQESTMNHGIVYINTSIRKPFAENETVNEGDKAFTFMEKEKLFFATLLRAFTEDRKTLGLAFKRKQTHAYPLDPITKGIIKYNYQSDEYSVLFESLINTQEYIDEFFKDIKAHE